MKLGRFAIGFGAGASVVILCATLVNAGAIGYGLLRPRGTMRILIVTDAVHVPQCECTFKSVGLAYYRFRGYS